MFGRGPYLGEVAPHAIGKDHLVFENISPTPGIWHLVDAAVRLHGGRLPMRPREHECCLAGGDSSPPHLAKHDLPTYLASRFD